MAHNPKLALSCFPATGVSSNTRNVRGVDPESSVENCRQPKKKSRKKGLLLWLGCEWAELEKKSRMTALAMVAFTFLLEHFFVMAVPTRAATFKYTKAAGRVPQGRISSEARMGAFSI